MTFRNLISQGLAAIVLLGLGTAPVLAKSLMDKLKDGDTIRVGYANTPPWAYPGPNNEPDGFVNKIVAGTLAKMGAKNIESVVTDWGGFVPGLMADRYDIITGGIYIIKSRCESVAFSNPIGVFGDVFIVPKGNPKNIETYEDITKTGATMATVTGYNIVEVAKKVGIPDAQVMKLPGPAEMFAALKAGRADVIGTNYFEARVLQQAAPNDVELTDPKKMPDWTLNWSGIAFKKSDADFVDAYNKAQAEYIGSEDMMKAVESYGYTKDQLPGTSTTQYACDNR